MKYIQLTRGYKAIVDELDFKYLNQWKWHYHSPGYAYHLFPDKMISMHQLLLSPVKGKEIDHINGNGLDNRKENLRMITHQENIRCRKSNKNNKSGFRGVVLCKIRQYLYWQAQITVNRKVIKLGYFKNKIEAAKAYDKAAINYFGIFAKPNFEGGE